MSHCARSACDQRDALGLLAALAGRQLRPVLCSFLTNTLFPALFLYFVGWFLLLSFLNISTVFSFCISLPG
jgi:hypothetical protein